VNRSTSLVGGKRHDFLTDASDVAALMGLEAAVHLIDGSDPLRLWPQEPLVVLGAGRHAERRVWLAQALAVLRLRLGRLYALGPARALELLTVVGQLLAPPEEDAPITRTLLEALPPRTAERVEAVIEQVGGAALPARFTGEAVLNGIVQTADRIGLLAAGRLRTSVEAVLRLAEPQRADRVARADLPWRIRDASRLQDLVKYALSDAYRQARTAIGIAM
jgi:hypothetical protein